MSPCLTRKMNARGHEVLIALPILGFYGLTLRHCESVGILL
ncbi:MAG: hypothetical protein ACI9SB_001270 [Candidatus Azotimanducaceae bacterium]|jgi:hypothetical protein